MLEFKALIFRLGLVSVTDDKAPLIDKVGLSFSDLLVNISKLFSVIREKLIHHRSKREFIFK